MSIFTFIGGEFSNIGDWIKQLYKIFHKFPQHIQEIISNPLSIATLIGCIALLIVLIKAKKIQFTPQLIARIGIALALATILKIFRIYHFYQGGSITFGSMVPIFIISFMYGPRIGFLTGFLYGVITFVLDPYILHPVQVLFDYPLPFMALGIAGYFKNNKSLGISISVFVRFICHFISGVAFFGSYAPEGTSPVIYSLLVNAPMVGIEGVICIILFAILPVERIINASSTNAIAE